MALPAWRTARNVMTYLHMPHEVATHSLAQAVLVSGRQLVVPKCEGKRLGAWAIEDPERDLTPGPWGILEPRPGSGRRVAARDLDLIIVPGVAFDRQGNRLGYGRGYYDSFLPRAAVEAKIVGIAFREQIVDGVPHEPRDFVIPLLVTADGVIES